ncbi:endo-beta-N-acetylglucosaminidase [Streptomyces reniochalinae]|uniref:Endo-beta-N-acetylglucosaminidase n=1 Tax=Streptomyces reniochalinae TaxID=2250578 RepID=A0A367EUD3_9ACTN|nr:endo-beta-N-acetylglucosaminidase [Streptomyces reniochalinae]RCG21631.1 endo-beta-N-acetylglucosaminidase [Streptomyces reniochalinae]
MRRRTVLGSATTAAAALLGPLTVPASGRAASGSAAARAASGSGGAGQPHASYWFPDSLPSGSPGEGVVWRSLKDWRPEEDADLPFNKASVPLARRFTPVAANTSARAEQARISALVAFDHTAGNPAQGGDSADYYAFTQWAYLDELVFWGGSAGEGLILAPNAPVVDAAHRNGVPVLGTVFLPPVGHGGRLRWTRDLVRRDASGGYPLADRLAEVAVAHGFDGWFVNAETEGGDAALAGHMHGFLRRMRALCNHHGLRLTWYDALTREGEVGWQGALNEANRDFFHDARGKVGDAMFLDFRWTPDSLDSSGRFAEDLGRDRYALQAGVDVEQEGWNTDVDWEAIVPTDGPHTVSYGFYRPEWTLTHLAEKERTPEGFHAADDRLWTGRSLDPTLPGHPGDDWRAPAAVVADRSTIDAVPFATTFNTGYGLRWYEEGRVTSDAQWNHLGLQDRLPARRWAVTTEGTRPQVSFDFADAWHGGSSLLVAGRLDAPVTIELYSTRLPVGPHTTVSLTHRAAEGPAGVSVELAVALGEPDRPGAPVPFTYLPAGTARPDGAGWVTATVRLGRHLPVPGPRTVRTLGVRVTPVDGPPGGTVPATSWRLGALAVRDGHQAPDAPPRALRVTEAAPDGDGTTALRLAWQPAPGQVRHYALHRLLPDGTRRFLGATCQHAFYVPGLRPEQGEKAARFTLHTVGELYTHSSSSASTSHPW